MHEIVAARALHVVGVVLWIGGVGMVTTVLLPGVRRLKDRVDRVAFFGSVERAFARQARASTLLVGATGFYMTWSGDLWDRFRDPTHWWMPAMVAVWSIFTIMLFLLEPLFLHRWLIARGRSRPESTFRIIVLLHWFLLAISVVTVAGAVAGSHGAAF